MERVKRSQSVKMVKSFIEGTFWSGRPWSRVPPGSSHRLTTAERSEPAANERPTSPHNSIPTIPPPIATRLTINPACEELCKCQQSDIVAACVIPPATIKPAPLSNNVLNNETRLISEIIMYWYHVAYIQIHLL